MTSIELVRQMKDGASIVVDFAKTTMCDGNGNPVRVSYDPRHAGDKKPWRLGSMRFYASELRAQD